MLDASFCLYLFFVLCLRCCCCFFLCVPAPLTLGSFSSFPAWRGKWTLRHFFFFGDIASPSVNIISAHLSLALSLISSVILPLCLHFLSFFFFPFSCSPSQTEGRTALPLLKAPSHCKRMSLSHCKQSAFIISYLLRPPRQQSWYEGRASVFGPVACRVKVCSSGK